MPDILTVRTPTLEIAYESHGRADGVPVVLLHGFPDPAQRNTQRPSVRKSPPSR